MPSRLSYKKPPKHWQYVVSKKQIREFARDSKADIRLVEYSGPAGKPHKLTADIHIVAEIESRFIDGAPVFRIRFSAFPVDLIESQAETMSKGILDDMRQHVHTLINRPPAVPDAQERIYFYDSSDNQWTPSFKTRKVEPHSKLFSRMNPWWHNPPPQTTDEAV